MEMNQKIKIDTSKLDSLTVPGLIEPNIYSFLWCRGLTMI